MSRAHRIALLMLASVLVLSAMPAFAAASGTRKTRRSAKVRQASATYMQDIYEAGDGDDTPAHARDVTSLFGGVGGDLYVEPHTISLAPTSGASCDEDWFRFDVSPADIASGTPFLIEADMRANPDMTALGVIEVYGPGLSNVSPGEPPLVEGTDLDSAVSGCVAASWMDPWHDDWHLTSLSFVPPSDGTYYFRVRPWRNPTDGSAKADYAASAGPYDLRLKHGSMTRVFGFDRVSTSVQVSREQFPDGSLATGGSDAFGDSLVIANGWNYPDALAGSALAGALNGPLLLTASNRLSRAASAEIDRVRPQHIYILGGTSAVSSNVRAALEAKFPGHPERVVRVYGSDRVATAKEVARKLYNDGGRTGLAGAFVANGWAFPDALAAAPMASLNNMPILLTHTGALDAVTSDAISDYGIHDVVIVGGTAAVSTTVENQLAALLGGHRHVRRIAGINRYDTAERFAAWASALATDDGGDPARVGTDAKPGLMQALDPTRIGVASGQNFPDALAGGVWCGGAHAPLLLTLPGSLSPFIYAPGDHTTPAGGDDYWTTMMQSVPTGFQRSYLFGGTPAVDDDTFRRLDAITGAGGGSL